MDRLSGKVGIVTGGASGMGRATCLAFAREGARVVVADIDGAGAEAVAKEVEAMGAEAVPVTVDISSAADMRSMVDSAIAEFGRLDILDNNAALLGAAAHSIDKDVVNTEPDDWDRVMAINLRGPYLGCKFAVPAMLATGGGSIVNISSSSALTGNIFSHAYGSSKAGVIALTQHVATTYGKQGIRCNAIAPGPVVTPAWGHITEEHRANLERHVLTPYLGRPEDIAEAVVFLASSESAYITGQVLCVDGGYLAHQPATIDMPAGGLAPEAHS
jgi:NAD(P)-dependent dehydrogenase (short-subunit alcohol dehydrogenase family)